MTQQASQDEPQQGRPSETGSDQASGHVSTKQNNKRDGEGGHHRWLDSPLLVILFIIGCMLLGIIFAFGIASAPDWTSGNLPKVILGSGTDVDRNMAPEDDCQSVVK